ncbi:hypothetical protein LPB03_02900 [Polaribacter vadi]|uniref:DUF4350 domain-containing protein n=1 Tax=Polaribacter vadi TaxID=1774273 RepID=A0A1B8U1S6_9FLAO|nr:hypothetical protein [Polaribacter vadi]AOW16478.1 hypothetical protein LPB03_02900 [Polaribacter vadi]OBY65823.1 hypothetical protein LPB3_02180 [Polaribacter vadi]
MKALLNISKPSILLLIVLVLASCTKTNWTENYREKEKSPFGTYIIHNEANELFKNQEIVTLKENFYDYLYFNYEVTGADFGSYICIKNSASKLTEDGVTDLLSFVYDGNSAFLSLNYFSDSLLEQLEITTNNLDKDVYLVEDLKALKGEFYLENNTFEKDTFNFDRNIRKHYFVTYNEDKTIVLGSAKIDGEKVPNFMKIYHGKGAIYVHSNPVVFTNYFMLSGKEKYAENVLSYVPSATVFWDPQIKRSEYSNESDEDNTSVFKFFLQHKTLTWFLFVSLAGVLLFMLFNARRKQRAIPIIHPLENTTVAFTQTISSLYLKEQDHKNLVTKKIGFFLEKVRTKYLLNTTNLNKEFIHNLAAKSGNNLQNTKYLINTIITLHKRSECTQEELLVLHKMIDNFFKKQDDGNTK